MSCWFLLPTSIMKRQLVMLLLAALFPFALGFPSPPFKNFPQGHAEAAFRSENVYSNALLNGTMVSNATDPLKVENATDVNSTLQDSGKDEKNANAKHKRPRGLALGLTLPVLVIVFGTALLVFALKGGAPPSPVPPPAPAPALATATGTGPATAPARHRAIMGVDGVTVGNDQGQDGRLHIDWRDIIVKYTAPNRCLNH